MSELVRGRVKLRDVNAVSLSRPNIQAMRYLPITVAKLKGICCNFTRSLLVSVLKLPDNGTELDVLFTKSPLHIRAVPLEHAKP